METLETELYNKRQSHRLRSCNASSMYDIGKARVFKFQEAVLKKQFSDWNGHGKCSSDIDFKRSSQETSNWHKNRPYTQRALTSSPKNDTMELCDTRPRIMKDRSVLS